MKKRGVSLASRFFVLLAFALAFFVSGVYAFSVGSPSAITVEPGLSTDVGFSIINLAEGADDIVVDVIIEQGGEYLTIQGESRVSVAAGEIGRVVMTATAPSSSVGDKVPATILFNSIEGGSLEGGTVDIGFGYRKNLDILVIEPIVDIEDDPIIDEEDSLGFIPWILLIVVVVLILVIWLVIKTRN